MKLFLEENFQALQEFTPSSCTQTSVECTWSVRNGASIRSLTDIINKIVLNILKLFNKGIGQVTAKQSSKHQLQCLGKILLKHMKKQTSVKYFKTLQSVAASYIKTYICKQNSPGVLEMHI